MDTMHFYIYDNLNVSTMIFLGDFAAKHNGFLTSNQCIYVIRVGVVLASLSVRLTLLDIFYIYG